jgi:hypothetical protein
LDNAFDRTVLAGRISTFQNDQDLVIAFDEVVLQFDQFDLELVEAVLVGFFRNRESVPVRFSFAGFLAHLLPHPPAVQKIVNGHVDESRVGAIQEALNQPNDKTPPTVPFEPRQDLLEKCVHVETRGRQHGEDDAKHKRKRGPDRQRPSHDFYIQHIDASTQSPHATINVDDPIVSKCLAHRLCRAWGHYGHRRALRDRHARRDRTYASR